MTLSLTMIHTVSASREKVRELLESRGVSHSSEGRVGICGILDEQIPAWLFTI
jgi:aspartate/tyrosine/aromatic aminotransferase